MVKGWGSICPWNATVELPDWVIFSMKYRQWFRHENANLIIVLSHSATSDEYVTRLKIVVKVFVGLLLHKRIKL